MVTASGNVDSACVKIKIEFLNILGIIEAKAVSKGIRNGLFKTTVLLTVEGDNWVRCYAHRKKNSFQTIFVS